MNIHAADLSSRPALSRQARLVSLVALAFGAMLLAGADGGCTITVTPHVSCPNLDDICPNLECEVFATNAHGCALCECAEPLPPEGCSSDADCFDWERCQLVAGQGRGECRDVTCPGSGAAHLR